MTKRKISALALAVSLAIGLLPPCSLMAQEQHGRPGGLFGGTTIETSNELMNRSGGSVGSNLSGQGFGATNGNLTGQTFGTPMGSGIFVLLAAGVGYATIKSMKKQNGKEK